jgi:hypothetical protein
MTDKRGQLERDGVTLGPGGQPDRPDRPRPTDPQPLSPPPLPPPDTPKPKPPEPIENP